MLLYYTFLQLFDKDRYFAFFIYAQINPIFDGNCQGRNYPGRNCHLRVLPVMGMVLRDSCPGGSCQSWRCQDRN